MIAFAIELFRSAREPETERAFGQRQILVLSCDPPHCGFDAGVHLKTAGTTWLEELIGLAESGGGGLAMAKDIYADAWTHCAELCAPYASVIDMDNKLPSGKPSRVGRRSLRPPCVTTGLPSYNPRLRQLLHVGYR